MDLIRQCAVVVPCFNEAGTIGELVRAVRRLVPRVIVIDDGSSDATSTLAKDCGAYTIRHATNRGKGAALRDGFQRAQELGFGWVLTMDGDGQHSSDDIPKFLACAKETGAPLVVGNRLCHAERMPWLRRRVNRWMTGRISQLTGVPLADSQCGFRLVRLDALAGLKLTADRFEVESEMLVAFLAASHRVEFVPIQVIYKGHPSKIHPLVDSWRWLRWWFAQRKQRPVSFAGQAGASALHS